MVVVAEVLRQVQTLLWTHEDIGEAVHRIEVEVDGTPDPPFDPFDMLAYLPLVLGLVVVFVAVAVAFAG